MLQRLHLAELVMLVEYTEVMIPVVYCFYLASTSQLPNRVYDPQLKDLDDDNSSAASRMCCCTRFWSSRPSWR